MRQYRFYSIERPGYALKTLLIEIKAMKEEGYTVEDYLSPDWHGHEVQDHGVFTIDGDNSDMLDSVFYNGD